MDLIFIFLTGIIATTLGTVAGGGGLISLPMMLLLGMPIHSAIGANKVSNTVSSFSSFFHLLKHKKISLKECYWIVPISITGGLSGGLIATLLHPEHLYIIAIILLLLALITSMIGKRNFQGGNVLKPTKISIPGLYGIGIYDGLFGPGQGTLMLYLFAYLKIDYIKAVGYVRFATFSSCIGAAAMYIASGKIMWGLTLALLCGSFIGAQIGVRVAEKIKPAYMKPILRIVTLALIVQVFVENMM
ncbi:sulfite exporter TauE/SafE family protein [Ornithinibacillus sp. BX22]|uniref:Probable membrane transporter protein n=2 Tax=Ornithinibacillus TaxID=484508 RepID=A0A923RHL7_9BACI|nr:MULTISPECIES: sulfite exporter TauE/SafE family protein [Ornithinibacillus]MBC5636203.1 sulfite exporter TauE/SafE family protein [Ornithinibacillus hominis]MBS3681043.1 sulfite exporter TauE/SafE family protein [Ornithinibacillus massiliensis]